MLTPEIVHRYLRQQCSVEEMQAVNTLLDDDPAAFDIYLPPDEALADNVRLHPALSEKMLAVIRRQTGGRIVRMHRPVRVAAAAAVTAMMALGAFWLTEHKTAAPGPTPTASESAVLAVANLTNQPKQVTLPDGSTVHLSPNSSIRYTAGFANAALRRVELTGDAFFRVADNAAHPFSVQSGHLLTTVLGTSFSVMAFPDSESIIIQLHSGKIVVAGIPAATRYLSKPVYLLPGDQLTYNKKTMLVKLTHSHTTPAAPRLHGDSTAPATTLSPHQPVQQPNWYAFHGQPLAQVLDQLSGYYETVIVYQPAEIKNKYFFGNFNRADDLDKILQDIALLNALTVQKKDNRYILRKRH